jgi:hypothetical protein
MYEECARVPSAAELERFLSVPRGQRPDLPLDAEERRA